MPKARIRGITVNIAARMEQAAPAGRIRISHDTWRHVRGQFDVTAEPPLPVKGIVEPVRSYLVEQARPRAFRLANRGIEGATTRLVGRAAEFKWLVDAYQGVLAAGGATCVSLVGEAGLGKSRLLHEFDNWLELRPEAVWFFHGRAQAHGRNIPYGLLRDLFAWRFEILESDTQATAQSKLAQGFGQLFGERADEQTALLGELIGLDYSQSPYIAGVVHDARQLRDRALHAGAQYFRLLHEGNGAPIVLLLDDLHWADDGSLDFVENLLDVCRDIPLLVLGVARPALYDSRPRWGDGPVDSRRIDLVPLSRASSRELADALLCRLDPIPPALRDLLATHAEGNPFFVEELLAMLIDDGVILTHAPGDPERWRVVPEKLLEMKVPQTLVALLQARLDGLPAHEKRTLQQASVIGHVFWDEPLERIEAGAQQAIKGLLRRDLTLGHEPSAFEGAREYVFKHHLLHQVTYASVLKRHKRNQHRQVADWLVTRSGERVSEYYGPIARHYEQAGDVENAITYLGKAGEAAARTYANASALDYLGRALALVLEGDAGSRYGLLLTRVDVLSNTGQRNEEAADITSLESMADLLDDDLRRAHVAGLRSSHAVATGDYPTAIAAAGRAESWAAAAGDRGAALTAIVNAARAMYYQGDPTAQARTEQALALARTAGNRRIETSALNQLGILAFESGQHATGREYYRQALAIARSIRLRNLESALLNNLGDAERYLGHYDAALDLLQAGLRICREIGQRMSEASMLCNLAWVAMSRGDASNTIALSEQAAAISCHVGDRDLDATARCILGHGYALAGDASHASAAYQDSLDIYSAIGRPGMRPEPLSGLARVALTQGANDEALRHVGEIVAHFDAGGTVDSTEDPTLIYLTCHQVMAVVGAPRAREFLLRAHERMMEQASALDPADCKSFLGNVPTSRAVLAAWNAEQSKRTS